MITHHCHGTYMEHILWMLPPFCSSLGEGTVPGGGWSNKKRQGCSYIHLLLLLLLLLLLFSSREFDDGPDFNLFVYTQFWPQTQCYYAHVSMSLLQKDKFILLSVLSFSTQFFFPFRVMW